MKLIGNIFIMLISLMLCYAATAQNKQRYLSFGPSTSSYKGDLNDYYAKISGAFYAKLINDNGKRLNSFLEFNRGSVTGQNRDFFNPNYPDIEPNRFFQTTYSGLSFNLKYNIINKNKTKVYLSQGAGLFRFIPKDEFGNEFKVSTRENEDYGRFSISLPRTAGIYHLLSNDYGLLFEVAQFNPMNDYIDNISKLGSTKNKDKILMFKLGVVVNITKKAPKEIKPQETISPTEPTGL